MGYNGGMAMIITTKKEKKKRLFVSEVREAKNSPKKSFPKNKAFYDGAFGIFKNSFGKMSSVAYINSLRKQWR